MLDKQQEARVSANFYDVQNGAWYRWLMEVLAAKRDAALQGVEDSEDWENMLRYKTELKTTREIINLINKFNSRTDSQ